MTVRLTGLWKKEDRVGSYLVGDISPSSILLVRENLNKTGANEPDYIVYILANQHTKKSKKTKTQAWEQSSLL